MDLLEWIKQGVVNGVIKIMEIDGGYSQLIAFKQDIFLVFKMIMLGYLAWFLARTFNKGEVSSLIKVIVVCECIRILTYKRGFYANEYRCYEFISNDSGWLSCRFYCSGIR
jgi:hypothetical protein